MFFHFFRAVDQRKRAPRVAENAATNRYLAATLPRGAPEYVSRGQRPRFLGRGNTFQIYRSDYFRQYQLLSVLYIEIVTCSVNA